MKRKTDSKFYISSVIAILLCGLSASYASEPAPSVSNELTLSIKAQGQARVIVNLTPPQLVNQDVLLKGKAFDDILTAEIERIQNAVLQRLRLAGFEASKVTKYRYTPQMALVVDEEGLDILRKDPDVIKVVGDGFHSGDLRSSVPIVFPSHRSASYSGKGWAVAVLDTGIDTAHFAFGSRVIAEGCASSTLPFSNYYSLCPDGADESNAAGSGVYCQARLNALSQQLGLPINANGTGCGHGTHVAGIAVGDFGAFAQGVAKDANIIPIQVFTAVSNNGALSVGAFSSDVLKGLERVYSLRNNHNIAAVNISIGGGGRFDTETACEQDAGNNGINGSSVLRPMIEMLRQAKIATVFASGNDNFQDGVGSFACIEPAITVGGVDDNDQRYVFSNSGQLLDFWAPGVAIESAQAGGFTSVSQGTSSAAPHVAGAWAVMKQSNPNATVTQIEQAFDATGQTIIVNSIARKRINIDQALDNLNTTFYIIPTPGGSSIIFPL